MRRRIGERGAVPLLLLLSGCALGGELARVDFESCVTASDCRDGFICIDNQCVLNTAAGPDVVHVEVAPPPGSPFPKTQFLEAKPIGGVRNLQLPSPAELRVRVFHEDQPIGATVTVFGRARIPDREVDVSQPVNADVINPSVLRLLPGVYTVRVIPNDPTLPGFEARDLRVRDIRSGEAETKEFLVPDYRVLYGRIVSSLSGTSTIAGVAVRAVGVRSGLPSTTSVSDETGYYELLLPHTGETSFLLSAVDESADEASWWFEQVIQVEANAGREKRIELERTNEALRGSARLKILGRGAGAGPEPVRNASVTLTASAAAGLDTRVYRLSGVTDAEGFVTATLNGASETELPLLRGRYTVDVRTPSQSDYASTKTLLDLTAAAPGVLLTPQIELGLRTRVVGTVRAPGGAPVQGAIVELVSLEEGGRTLDEKTVTDGSFVAAVDPGRYLIVIRPPREVGGQLLPMHVQEVIVDEGARFDLPPIDLPFGTEVTGTVTGADVGPLGDARVEFFIRQSDRTLSIARTTSDLDGTYSVVLPNAPR